MLDSAFAAPLAGRARKRGEHAGRATVFQDRANAIGWFGPELSVNKPVSGCNGADYYLLYAWGLAR